MNNKEIATIIAIAMCVMTTAVVVGNAVWCVLVMTIMKDWF